MVRILGLDPGTLKIGVAILDFDGANSSLVGHWTIKTKARDSLALRLKAIHIELKLLIDSYKPSEAAVEQVFVGFSAKSSLLLGQARGASILTLSLSNLLVFEYSPRTVKQSVAGYGNASKEELQKMVNFIMKGSSITNLDESDAVAIALCHNSQRTLNNIYQNK